MPFRRKKKDTYKINNKGDKAKNLLVLATNKVLGDEYKKGGGNRKAEYVSKETKQRNNQLSLKSDIAEKENISSQNKTTNSRSESLQSIPKITIDLCEERKYQSRDENDNYREFDSISLLCLDSSSEDDNDSDYDQFGDFKPTCSADVTTDEEMEDELESTA